MRAATSASIKSRFWSPIVWRALPLAVLGRVVRVFTRRSLVPRYLLASLCVVALGAVLIGTWASRQAQREVLNRLAASTGLLVDAMFANDLQPIATQASLDSATIT